MQKIYVQERSTQGFVIAKYLIQFVKNWAGLVVIATPIYMVPFLKSSNIHIVIKWKVV